MRHRIVLSAAGLAIAGGLIVVPVAPAGGDGASTNALPRQAKIGAWLTPEQQIPPGTSTLSTTGGKFTATLTRRGNRYVMRYLVVYKTVTGATNVTFRRGVFGRGSAPIIETLCGGAGRRCNSPFRGTERLTLAQVRQVLAGLFHVQINTLHNDNGEIRGQIGRLYTVRTVLNAAQEVPPPAGVPADAAGLFTGMLVKYGARGHFEWRLTSRNLTGEAQAAHIHAARRGQAGNVLENLCGTDQAPDCASGVTGDIAFHDSPGRRALAQLHAGRTYVNVHTAANQTGEIRGQIPKPRKL